MLYPGSSLGSVTKALARRKTSIFFLSNFVVFLSIMIKFFTILGLVADTASQC